MTKQNEKNLGSDENCDYLIEKVNVLEKDHCPDGWPAIQMQDVTELKDEIVRLRSQRDRICEEGYEAVMCNDPQDGDEIWQRLLEREFKK